MADQKRMQTVHDLLSPDHPDQRASTLIVGKSPEAVMYYNLLQSFDARIYLCSTQMTFERRLIEDPAIKLILLFETNFSEVTRQALSSFCERSEPLHIITMRIVSIPEDDHDADAFSFTYGAFKFDDTYVAERVFAESAQALDRASQTLNDPAQHPVSGN